MQMSPVEFITTLPLATFGNESGPWDSEWWWVWRLTMFLVFVALVALAIWWVRRNTPPREISGLERARGILAERYAHGEIDGDEYRERLSQLE